jgi:hypothetical protein
MAVITADVQKDGRSTYLALPQYKVTVTSTGTPNFITIRNLSRRQLQQRLLELSTQAMMQGHGFKATGLNFGQGDRATLY